MKKSKSGKKHFSKTIILPVAMILAAGTMFQGVTEAAAASEYSRTNTVSTSYVDYGGSSKKGQDSLPEGYTKANYTVRTIDLEYYRNQTPTSKDMAKEDAAEIGAQALWSVFGLNLEGQVIELGYQPANDSLPRSAWYADVLIDGKLSYYFSVDSITGDLLSLGRSRTLDKNVSVAFDAALAENSQEYAALAKETAEKYNVVHGEVASVSYNCQGYGNNDPDITFDIKGENGEVASMTFSRYDKALLGISYNSEYKYVLENIQKMERDMQARAAEHQKPGTSDEEGQTLTLEGAQ